MSNDSGFRSADNKPSSQVPAGTQLYHSGTGQTGNADGYGGVNVDKR